MIFCQPDALSWRDGRAMEVRMVPGARFGCFAAVVVFAAVLRSSAVSAADYVVTVLPSLGGTSTGAIAIDGDQVVGGGMPIGAPQHAFSWTAAGGLIEILPLPGDNTNFATDVSNGQVVGLTTTCGCGATAECCATVTGTSSGYPGFSWTQGLGAVGLPFIPHAVWHGYIVGTVVVGGGFHGVVQKPTGEIIDLGTLGGTNSEAIAVDGGVVAGNAQTPSGVYHSFIWTEAGGVVDLGDAGSVAGELAGGFTTAEAITAGPVVYGHAGKMGVNDFAFAFWSPATGWARFAKSSEAGVGGASAGQVVGAKADGPFSWTQAGGFVNLSAYLTGAADVSGGKIVGSFVHGSGAFPPADAILLTPAACGDGTIQASEQCDDGNGSDADACKTDCTPNLCGDGVVRTGVEECDDGNQLAADGCDVFCRVETIVTGTIPAGGGTISGSGASVTSPNGGAVSIVETSATGSPAVGFGVIGKLFLLTIPPATASQPLNLTFTIPAADLPSGTDYLTMAISKDGVVVPACSGPAGEASPDPCVTSRTLLGNGDVQVVVLTSTASAWAFTAPLCGGRQASGLKMTVAKLNTAPGDDKLNLKGSMTLPVPFSPALDPLTTGVRLQFSNAGATMLDVTIPGGAYGGVPAKGWKVNGSHTKWTYKDTSDAAPAGFYQVLVRDASKKVPGLVEFQIKGKNGNFAVSPATLPMWAEVILAPPDGQCAVAAFDAPTTCAFSASGATLKCK
jgi:cysteine-rich repeat protein/probable HAF family extracellular repeat protein